MEKEISKYGKIRYGNRKSDIKFGREIVVLNFVKLLRVKYYLEYSRGLDGCVTLHPLYLRLGLGCEMSLHPHTFTFGGRHVTQRLVKRCLLHSWNQPPTFI